MVIKSYSTDIFSIIDNKNRSLSGLFKYSNNKPKNGDNKYMFIEGTIIESNGTKLSGKFYNNILQEGTIEFPNRNFVKGSFINGILSNGIKYISSEDCYYNGDFDLNGRFINGTIKTKNGDIYKIECYPPSLNKSIIYYGTISDNENIKYSGYLDSNFKPLPLTYVAQLYG